ncbi:hypothetical protein [Archangium sp.]|uniref:hypothetical protein n=1 Tax=Archangium sp. TaxID=1872627 RepID=UPI002D68CD4F|nr:hypothetical protein [Archangium sp.]HYO53870.1 hypothetical protein [Archangium sp.]
MPSASGPAAPSEAPPEPPPVRTVDVVELPELPPPEPESPILASEAGVETRPSQLLETDSESWEWPERQAARPSPGDDDRVWLSEAAEAARAGNTSISATEPVEEVTIATGTVEGRVKRVRPGTLEVSDDEGNVYELRIDGRSRGLRRGRHVPLKDITEGTPVRASFDLVGGGESLARDIQLRR